MAVHSDNDFREFAAILRIDQEQGVLFLIGHDQQAASGRRRLCNAQHPRSQEHRERNKQ